MESSPGRGHAYWIVNGLSLDQFAGVQKAIIARFDGDKSVHDLPRVMRLPGFIHRKVKADGSTKGPFLSRIIELSDAAPYSAERILTEFPPNADAGGRRDGAPAQPTAVTTHNAAEPLNLSLGEMQRPLQDVAGAGYEDWLRVGMALHHETAGDLVGLFVWDEWSRSRPKYPGTAELERKWSTFRPNAARPVTMRTVIKEANEIRRKAEAAADFQPGAVGPARKFTEFGNADRLLDRYGSNLMFVPELGTWFQWSNTNWFEAPAGLVEWLAQLTVRALPDELRDDTPDEARSALLKFAAQSQKASMVGSMVKLASFDPKVCVPAAALDKEPHILGVGNGAVDLRTGELLVPDRERRITIATGTPYDPDAPALLFEETVGEAFYGDVETIAFFQRLMGYALLSQPREDLLVIPFGSGANGKSTILGAIADTLGPHLKGADAGTFLDAAGGGSGGPREDLLRLRGARLVWINEPDEGSVLREGLVKGVTGGDPVTARAPYARASIEFVPSFVPILCTNHKPIIRGNDHGIWRRIMLIPFRRRFDKDSDVTADAARGQKLKAELPGILRWCVNGALAYQRHGLQPPTEVIAASAEYRDDMDLLTDWLADCCEIGPQCVASMNQLWRSWENWALTNGELRLIPNRKVLGRRLANRFSSIRDSHGLRGRGFKGVAVRNSWDNNRE